LWRFKKGTSSSKSTDVMRLIEGSISLNRGGSMTKTHDFARWSSDIAHNESTTYDFLYCKLGSRQSTHRILDIVNVFV